MIITRKKPFEEVKDQLKKAKKIYLLGCALCATTSKTGGEKEIEEMKGLLEKEGKEITATAVIEPACSLLEIKKLYRRHKNEIDLADIILSMACGGGSQAVTEVVEGKEVLPANDTLFQGEITVLSTKKAKFEQRCSLCGDCMLSVTQGICSRTMCPKELVNGPCGGIKNGKCEVNRETPCAWLRIYERMKRAGHLEALRKRQLPRDNRKSQKPQIMVREW